MTMKPRHGYLICQRIKPPQAPHGTLDLSEVHKMAQGDWLKVLDAGELPNFKAGNLVYVHKDQPEIIVLDGEVDTAVLIHESMVRMTCTDNVAAKENPITTGELMDAMHKAAQEPNLVIPRTNGKRLVH